MTSHGKNTSARRIQHSTAVVYLARSLQDPVSTSVEWINNSAQVLYGELTNVMQSASKSGAVIKGTVAWGGGAWLYAPRHRSAPLSQTKFLLSKLDIWDTKLVITVGPYVLVLCQKRLIWTLWPTNFSQLPSPTSETLSSLNFPVKPLSTAVTVMPIYMGVDGYEHDVDHRRSEVDEWVWIWLFW